ncbi:xanthine dehydrogenase family protein molybdopterin-binding subunit [Paenibacillus apii]|uniref:xanthine dehydrogenase family protein molybdopterin-binding subunit n=1 Tax=Paenibacillus apii TaxID=1850370 RepID=UPI001438DDB4|nr:xanthine dehydrogenase family protein molybdopterin-binding subunit [Paenibacillus apii]NJJ39611.1 xanthine dehydrogenase family protein molybdopterin-binding subunit [Paenibacillus apii]
MSIGASLKRLEDYNLLTGRGQYVGDLQFPDQCEAVIIRSPHAHAIIRSIDVEEARRFDGVLLILTASDLPGDLRPIPMRLSPDPILEKALQYPLAKDRVRYVGDPVAVIVAKDRYMAEDAADFIKIEYDVLPPVTDAVQSLQPDAPLLHPDAGTNEMYLIHGKKGDAAERLKTCEHVLKEELYVQRHSGIPMETRGLLALCDEDERLTVYGAAKVVHFNHQLMARLLNKNIEEIRLIETDCGGGFGPRGEFYPEDYLIPFAAMRLKRPVRWIEDRLEHFKATNHSREQKHQVTVGFDGDGRIYALRDEIFFDQGGYIRTHGTTVPSLTQAMFPGPYDFSDIEIVTHLALTNKTPVGTYRGPGRFEGTFVRERVIDMVAAHLKLDPTVVRERNYIRPEQMPYSNGLSALGQVIEYDSGNYAETLDYARKFMGWEQFAGKQARAREEGRFIGLGFASFVEKSGFGPWEFAEVEMRPDGRVICKTGLTEVGQGITTTLAQICSDQLGIPYEYVSVVHGDTDLVEKGNGSFATRGAVVGGSAAWHAAGLLKEKLLEVAAGQLAVPVDMLALKHGSVVYAEAEQVAMPLDELLQICSDRGISLCEKYTFHIEHMTYPYGCHAAEVELDPGTGALHILNYYIAYDLGKAINPMLVEGQLIGGMAQGLGGAIYEELKYDEIGQLVSGSFMDYLIPTSMEVPEVRAEILENYPSPLNPLGVKGAGEGGTVAVAPAIANAIVNAMQEYAIPITSLPLRPEHIRKALKQMKPRTERRSAGPTG